MIELDLVVIQQWALRDECMMLDGLEKVELEWMLSLQRVLLWILVGPANTNAGYYL